MIYCIRDQTSSYFPPVSPLILLANWMSFSIIVTCFVWHTDLLVQGPQPASPPPPVGAPLQPMLGPSGHFSLFAISPKPAFGTVTSILTVQSMTEII